ncbi:MAG: hypothetical protein V3V74_00020 [Nitrosomonadaceae bacterium]
MYKSHLTNNHNTPFNKGKLVGQKASLKLKGIWPFEAAGIEL